jgi:hypothetical protein
MRNEYKRKAAPRREGRPWNFVVLGGRRRFRNSTTDRVVPFAERPRHIPMPGRRVSARVAISTHRGEPCARSRPLSIRERDLPELIACIERLEGRA